MVLDPEFVPTYSQLHHRSGRFCPNCGAPLDEASAKAHALTLDFGPNTGDVRANSIATAKAWGEDAWPAKAPEAAAEPITT